jgi:hypothetical protein
MAWQGNAWEDGSQNWDAQHWDEDANAPDRAFPGKKKIKIGGAAADGGLQGSRATSRNREWWGGRWDWWSTSAEDGRWKEEEPNHETEPDHEDKQHSIPISSHQKWSAFEWLVLSPQAYRGYYNEFGKYHFFTPMSHLALCYHDAASWKAAFSAAGAGKISCTYSFMDPGSGTANIPS